MTARTKVALLETTVDAPIVPGYDGSQQAEQYDPQDPGCAQVELDLDQGQLTVGGQRSLFIIQ